MSKKVIVPLADGFEEIEALTIVDILRRAHVEVCLAALESLHVKGAHGVVVVADALLRDIIANDYDMIALPGGLPGATNLAHDLDVQAILKAFNAQNKTIGAICAAPYALKSAGVLKQHYTCYPAFSPHIDHEGFRANDALVIDENIITSQGPSTAMLFALALVEHLCGADVRDALAKDLLL